MLTQSSKPPAHDLRAYAAKAILPEMKFMHGHRAPPGMPKPGHKSHRNLLRVRAEPWRELEIVWKIKQTTFARMVLDYHKQMPNIHLENALDRSDLPFCVEAVGFSVQPLTLLRPSTITKVAHWCEMIALQTAQSIVHSAFPNTSQWTISSNEEHNRDIDSSIMKQMAWVNTNSEGTPEGYHDNLNAMLVFVQPPWILSPKDFRQLTSRRDVTALKTTFGQADKVLKSSERVWAKLWDVCVDARCPWFVLTSYGQWAFGVFTAGWSNVFITAPIAFDSNSPSVIQVLCYWMMSSIGSKGSFSVPEIPEPITNSTSLIPRQKSGEKIKYYAEQIDSDSEWEGQDDEPRSINGSQWRGIEDLSDNATARLGGGVQDMPHWRAAAAIDSTVPMIDQTEWIKEWLANPLVPKYNCSTGRGIRFGPADDSESLADGTQSIWSGTSVPQDDMPGDWVMMNPKENVAPFWGGIISDESTDGFRRVSGSYPTGTREMGVRADGARA